MGCNKTFLYFCAFVSRCLFEFVLGGSMKTYGLLTTYITDNLGIRHSVLGFTLCLQQSIGYLAAPLISQLVSNYGNRLVASLGGFMFGLGYLGQSFFHHRLIFFIVFCVCSGFGSGCLTLSSYFHMLQVFGEHFGLASSVASQCLFLGVCLVPLMFDHLWQQFGLRGALAIFSAFCWNCLVSAALMKPNFTKKSGITPKNRKENVEDNCQSFTKKLKRHFQLMNQLIKEHKRILFLLIIVYAHFASYFSWALFLVPVAQQRGFDQSSAVLLSTAGGAGGIVGRLASSILFALDNTQPFCHYLIPFALQTLAFVGIAYSQTLTLLLIFSGLSGFTLGFIDGSLPGFIPLNLSEKEIPIAFTLHFLVYAVGMETGSYFSGLMFDIYSSYTAVFLLTAAFSVVASHSALIWQLAIICCGGKKLV